VRGIGNVLKDPVPVELLTAVRKALTGKTLLNRELAMRLIRRLAEDVSRERLGPSTPEPPSTEPAGKNNLVFTPRDLEVLTRLTAGKTNRKIAPGVARGSIDGEEAHGAYLPQPLGLGSHPSSG
jgi:DNA-binding NarL/FixJ family response regulator